VYSSTDQLTVFHHSFIYSFIHSFISINTAMLFIRAFNHSLSIYQYSDAYAIEASRSVLWIKHWTLVSIIYTSIYLLLVPLQPLIRAWCFAQLICFYTYCCLLLCTDIIVYNSLILLSIIVYALILLSIIMRWQSAYWYFDWLLSFEGRNQFARLITRSTQLRMQNCSY